MNLKQLIEKGYKEELTKEEAIFIAKSKIIETWKPRAIVAFQLYQSRLCMAVNKF